MPEPAKQRIVDQHGNPYPAQLLRMSIGFVPKLVKAEDGDIAYGVTPPTKTKLDW
jgi:hypothetical protein